MIRPVRWPSIARFVQHAHGNAKRAAWAYRESACEDLNRQAHRRLCDELRALAACMRMEATDV